MNSEPEIDLLIFDTKFASNNLKYYLTPFLLILICFCFAYLFRFEKGQFERLEKRGRERKYFLSPKFLD